MTKLVGASLMVIVAILGLVFAIGFLVLMKLHLPIGLTMALTSGLALVIVMVQFCLGPMIIDWIVKIRWTSTKELGPDFADWMTKSCTTFRISEPRFGIIEEAAPNAFTYGHGAYDARVVVTRGLIDILTPEEFRAVVAHELGHIKHRDFVIMTMVQALVLMLWSLYYSSRFNAGRNNWYIMLSAYVAYWASYYASLFLSRIREFMADYASAQITGNPNHLSYALVKIAYGLAKTQTVGGATVPVSAPPRIPNSSPVPPPAASPYAYDADSLARAGAQIDAARYDNAHAIAARAQAATAPPQGVAKPKAKQQQPPFSAAQLGAFGVMGASSMRCAVAWSGGDGLANPDTFTTAARWELFNPWGRIAQVFSTHPLIALRIKALQKLNRLFNQPDAFDFSKIKPAKYKGFTRDLVLVSMPWVGGLIGLGIAGASYAGNRVLNLSQLFMPLLGFSAGRLIVLLWSYTGEFKPSKVIRLLGEVEVSHVNPIATAIEGTFTGRISPGIAWASDFIVQDDSGFMACLYRQPFGLMETWFGFTNAERFVGKRVRVYGWYRRYNAPYLEIHHFDVIDTGEKVKAHYFPWAVAGNLVLIAVLAACLVMTRMG